MCVVHVDTRDSRRMCAWCFQRHISLHYDDQDNIRCDAILQFSSKRSRDINSWSNRVVTISGGHATRSFIRDRVYRISRGEIDPDRVSRSRPDKNRAAWNRNIQRMRRRMGAEMQGADTIAIKINVWRCKSWSGRDACTIICGASSRNQIRNFANKSADARRADRLPPLA